MDLPDPSDRLNSWKEIAAFLGRTVRTVQRWEKTDGLPLRRGGPGQRGAVCASKQELSDWWQRRRSTLVDEGDDDEVVPSVVEEPATSSPPRQRQLRWLVGLPLVGVVVAIAVLSVPGWDLGSEPVRGPLRLGRLLADATSEGRTLASTQLGSTPADLLVDPQSDRLYVALPSEDAVAVVDADPGRVLDRIPAVDGVHKLALSSDGRRLFVGGLSEFGVIELANRSLRRFAVEGLVRDIYVQADDRHAWIALAQGGLKILDTIDGGSESIPTVGCPMGLAADRAAGRVFVTYQCGGPGGREGHDAIEIIDERTRAAMLTRVGLPLVGGAIAVSPDGEHVWVDTLDACSDPKYDHIGCPPGRGPVLHALRTSDLERLLTLRIPVENSGTAPVFVPDGSRLVAGADGIHVIDRALGVIKESLRFGKGKSAFSRNGRRLFFTSAGDRALFRFDIQPAPDDRILNGLAAHLSADGTTNDIVGGMHGLAGEDVRFVPGRLGQAFDFSPQGPGISFGDRLEVDVTSSSATFAVWIKPGRSGSPMSILERENNVDGWQFQLDASGRPTFCFALAPHAISCGGERLTGTRALPAGVWSHVALVRADDRVELFIDAQPAGTQSLAGYEPGMRAEGEHSTVRLGAGPDGATRFAGMIDELTLFRRALTSTDLMQLMRATMLDPRR